MKLQKFVREIYAVQWFPGKENTVGFEEDIEVKQGPYGYFVDGIVILPGQWIILWGGEIEVWTDAQFQRAKLKEMP